jgi:2-methylcitrate dehydratase PrpD
MTSVTSKHLPNNYGDPVMQACDIAMTHKDKDPAQTLARYISQASYEQLPQDCVVKCKAFVLDTIGVAIAGTTAEGFEAALRLQEQWGGRPACTVIASKTKLSAPQAAFLNGIAIHARDFDDTHDVAIVHANACVFPSALAAAEHKGDVTGKQFITALTVGIDFACRLGLALKHYVGWHYSSICGVFGAAAAACKILQLDAQQTSHALGIAFAQAAGNIQSIRDGALTKRMQLGFSARAGLESAYLAELGVTGTVNTFQGPYGFLQLFDTADPSNAAQVRHRDSGHYGEHELTDALGRRFEIENLSMKPYPNCRATHPAITGILHICAKHSISADQVDRITIVLSKRSFLRVGKSFSIDDEGPLQVKAQFCIAYCVAVAVCRQRVSLADFEERHIRDPRVFDVMDRVEIRTDESFLENLPLRLEVHMRNGNVHAETVVQLKGSPSHPLNETEIAEKFSSCCELSATPFSSERIASIRNTTDRLESLVSVCELSELL